MVDSGYVHNVPDTELMNEEMVAYPNSVHIIENGCVEEKRYTHQA